MNLINILKINKGFTDKLFFFIPIIFIIVGTIIRIQILFYNNSFWLDECALGLNIIHKSYVELLTKPLESFQVAPPLFLIISKFILQHIPLSIIKGDYFENKDFILRIFPFLCSIISLPLFLYLTNLIFKNKYINTICTCMLALNPISIYYAAQFKQYSCELMITIILLIVFFSIQAETITKNKIILSSIVILIAPYFSFSSYFIILAGFIYFLYETIKTKKFKILLIFMPFFINIFLLLYYFIPTQNNTFKYMQLFWEETNSNGFITKENFRNIFNSQFNFLFNLWWIQNNIHLYLTMICIYLLYLNKNKKNIIILSLPIIFILIASYLKLYPFSTRLILFLLPIIIILYSQTIFILKKKTLNIIIFIVCILLCEQYIKPIKDYIINRNANRELFQQLFIKNPKLENIIADPIIYKYYSYKRPIYEETPYINSFEDSNIPYYINKKELKDLWFYVPFTSNNYAMNLDKYLNESDVIIKEKYIAQSNNQNYIIHITKPNN